MTFVALWQATASRARVNSEKINDRRNNPILNGEGSFGARQPKFLDLYSIVSD